MITFPDEVQAAYSRSKNIIRKTPLDHSPSLSNIIDGDVYLSWITFKKQVRLNSVAPLVK